MQYYLVPRGKLPPASIRSSAARLVRLRVSAERDFTSAATTANPRPVSPARAASMAALSARRFVWLATSRIALTIGARLWWVCSSTSRCEPPEGKLQDQGIGPEKLRDLRLDIVRQPVAVESLFRGRDGYKPFAGRQRREVRAVDLGFPPHSVEVGNLNRVARCFQRLDCDITQRRGEGFRFRVGEDDEHVHGEHLLVGEDITPS